MNSADHLESRSRQPFGHRLGAAMQRFGPVCVGVDPHPSLLASWGLDDSVDGLAAFAETCVEAFAGQVASVKPQSAFFERHGSAGVAILERVVAELAEADTLCIVDAKRGDIGSTMHAYADAYLGERSPLAGDAVTLSPYLGFGSLQPALDTAEATGRGVFVLALTSNPDGPEVQHAGAPKSVAAAVCAHATQVNAAAPQGKLGSVGLVVGATVGDAVARLGLDLAATRAPLLAPGVGAQGAGPEELHRVFGDARPQVLASTSREVLSAGPSVPALRSAAHAAAQRYAP